MTMVDIKCNNGGRCFYVNNEDGIVCRCPEGWTGKYCQIGVE